MAARARPGELAKLLRLAPNSVTTLVNGLTARDLVTRTSGGGDRRTVALELTGAGAAAVRQWQETNAAILRAALASLHPGWQHLITAALPALSELITAIDDFAGQGLRPAGPAAPQSPPAASTAGPTPDAGDSR